MPRSGLIVDVPMSIRGEVTLGVASWLGSRDRQGALATLQGLLWHAGRFRAINPFTSKTRPLKGSSSTASEQSSSEVCHSGAVRTFVVDFNLACIPVMGLIIQWRLFHVTTPPRVLMRSESI